MSEYKSVNSTIGILFNCLVSKYLVIEIKYHKSSYGWTSDGKQMSDEWIKAKLRKQVSEDLFEDIMINDYGKFGLRYRPDLDRMVQEEITW